MTWEEFIKYVAAGITGFLSSQFVHKLSIKKDNIGVNRERLLENVLILKNYINYLIETSYLGSELIRLNELMESVRTNSELLDQEINRNQEEKNEIAEKLKNSNDLQELEELRAKLDLLSERISTTSQKHKQNEALLKKISQDEIERNQERLHEISLHLKLDNIATGLVLVDPSGKIIAYLSELQEIYLDPENLAKNQKRAILLQMKIDSIITKKIEKFGLRNL